MSQRGQKRTRRNSNSDSDSDLDDLSSHFSGLASPTTPSYSYSYAPVSIPEEDGGARRIENKVKTIKKRVTKKVTKYFIDPRTSNVTEIEVTEDEERKVYSQESKKAEEHRPSQKRQRIEYPMLGAPMAHNNNSSPVNYLTYPAQHQSQQRPRNHRSNHSPPRAILPAPQSPQPNQNQQQKPLVFLSPSERGYTTPRNASAMQYERDIPSRPRPGPAQLNYDQQQTPRDSSSSSFQRPTVIISPTCPLVLRPPVSTFGNLASLAPTQPLPSPLAPTQPLPSPPQVPQISLPLSPFASTFGTFWKKPDNAQDTTTDEDSYSDSENEDNEKETKNTTTTTTTTNNTTTATKE